MKLDPSIKSLSDILTPFDTERAKDFIEQKGFFANSIDCFRAGEPYCAYGTLTRVFDDQDVPYLEGHATCYSFFIPESSLKQGSSLKPKEKQYRPFTPEEFCTMFCAGLPVKFRKKGDPESQQDLIMQGIWFSPRDGKTVIYARMGSYLYSFDELFNDFEWRGLFKRDFEPFGVEVEE